ncbi:MAG: hypothetical protein H0U70_03260 [Tatlockia sp.]|nr:hypothetical protein [Tatlockia sp.]
MTNPIEASGAGVSQADFLKLFMQELTYQDPLKPLDNREFMAQMAGFAALQEAQASSNSLQILTGLTNVNLSLMLLGKNITVKGYGGEGKINRVNLVPNSAPTLDVTIDDKHPTIQLTDISSIGY